MPSDKTPNSNTNTQQYVISTNTRTAFKWEAMAAHPTDKLKDWAKPRMGK